MNVQSLSALPADRSRPWSDGAIGDLLRGTAARTPDAVGLIAARADGEELVWTFAELLADAEQVAYWLLDRAEPGERVAIWAHNVPEWPLVAWGAALAGVVLVGINPALGLEEGGYILRHSEAVLCLHADRVRDNAIGDHVATILESTDALREALPVDHLRGRAAAAEPRPLPTPGTDDPAQVQYTSGTTGRPKGVVIAHRTFVNVPELCVRTAAVPEGGLLVNPLPMFHTAGGGVCTFGPVAIGTGAVLVEQFDPGRVLDLLERHRAAALGAVPTVLIALLQHPSFADRDLSGLRAVIVGGALVPGPIVRRVQTETPARITVVFGMTEIGGVVVQQRPDDDLNLKATSIGRPLPHAETKIVSSDSGETVPVGTAGELCVRGPQLMLGYLKDDEANRRTVDPDGWLHTGDLCSIDASGAFRVTGRAKDLIIRGGENIAPVEVEECLHAVAGVADACAIGVPDERLGETVGVVLRIEEGAEVRRADLEAHAATHLAFHKRPVHLFVTDAFPLTASGKVQKFLLREQVAAGTLTPLA